jgi:hypothetical protein
MKLRLALIGISLSVAGIAGTAQATLIDIVSEAGTSCTYESGSGLAGTCTTETITPHGLWQSNDPVVPGYGGVWVSYADTGINGSTVAPTSGDAIFSITETFTVSESSLLDFWIWADDTADLFLDGTQVFSANFAQNICANGQIGCEPGEYFNLNQIVGAGTHEITMSVYQIGTGTTNASNPFGVLYSGRVSTAVPEPGTLALFGIGLLGIGAAGRRKKA